MYKNNSHFNSGNSETPVRVKLEIGKLMSLFLNLFYQKSFFNVTVLNSNA